MPETRSFPVEYATKRRYKYVAADCLNTINAMAGPPDYAHCNYGGIFNRCGWTHIPGGDSLAEGFMLFQLGARVYEQSSTFHGTLCYGAPYDAYFCGTFFKIYNPGEEAPCPCLPCALCDKCPCCDACCSQVKWVPAGLTYFDTAANLASAMSNPLFTVLAYIIPAGGPGGFPNERQGIHIIANIPGPALNFFRFDGNQFGGSLIGPGITQGGGYMWRSNGIDNQFTVLVKGAAIGQALYPPLVPPETVVGEFFFETIIMPGEGIQFDLTFLTGATFSYQVYAANNIVVQPPVQKFVIWCNPDGFAIFEPLPGRVTSDYALRPTSLWVTTPKIYDELKIGFPPPVSYCAFAANAGQLITQDWYNGGFGGMYTTAFNGTEMNIGVDSTAYPRLMQLEWHNAEALMAFANQPLIIGAVLCQGQGRFGEVGIVGTLRDVAVGSQAVASISPTTGPMIAGVRAGTHNFVVLEQQPGGRGGGFGFFTQTRASVMFAVPRQGSVWNAFEIYEGGDVVSYDGHEWEAISPEYGVPPEDCCCSSVTWQKLS